MKRISTSGWFLTLTYLTWFGLFSVSQPSGFCGETKTTPNATQSKVEKLNSETLQKIFDFAKGVKERKWRYIVLHHSATSTGTAKAFDRFHRETFKDPDGLEYHFVILNGSGKGSLDGLIEVGPRWKKQMLGNHLFRPELAQESIAICFVGNFEEKDRVTKNQFHFAVELIKRLMTRYGIDEKDIITHKDIDGDPKNDSRPTSKCPGKYFPYMEIINELKRQKI